VSEISDDKGTKITFPPSVRTEIDIISYQLYSAGNDHDKNKFLKSLRSAKNFHSYFYDEIPSNVSRPSARVIGDLNGKGSGVRKPPSPSRSNLRTPLSSYQEYLSDKRFRNLSSADDSDDSSESTCSSKSDKVGSVSHYLRSNYAESLICYANYKILPGLSERQTLRGVEAVKLLTDKDVISKDSWMFKSQGSEKIRGKTSSYKNRLKEKINSLRNSIDSLNGFPGATGDLEHKSEDSLTSSLDFALIMNCVLGLDYQLSQAVYYDCGGTRPLGLRFLPLLPCPSFRRYWVEELGLRMTVPMLNRLAPPLPFYILQDRMGGSYKSGTKACDIRPQELVAPVPHRFIEEWVLLNPSQTWMRELL
jgi:hypothetical protein